MSNRLLQLEKLVMQFHKNPCPENARQIIAWAEYNRMRNMRISERHQWQRTASARHKEALASLSTAVNRQYRQSQELENT